MRSFLSALVMAAALLVFGPLAHGQPGQPAAPHWAPAGNLSAGQPRVTEDLLRTDMDRPWVGVDAPTTFGETVARSVAWRFLPPDIRANAPQARLHAFFVGSDRGGLASPKHGTIAGAIG